MRKAIKLQAQIPGIIAAFARIREGKEPVASPGYASVAANFLYQLTGNEPDKVAIEALDKALVLHADHELNASTFAARVTVATLTDIYSGILPLSARSKDLYMVVRTKLLWRCLKRSVQLRMLFLTLMIN